MQSLIINALLNLINQFMKKSNLILITFSTLILFACGSSKDGSTGGGGFNIFTLEQDKEFGAQVATEIDGNSAQYPLLDSVEYKEAYDYVYKVRDKILNSGNVKYKDDFQWRLRIIHDDSTLNAFCTPGGYIYIYTGILKFLDAEDQFAGVLGHEIAHADMRHSTRQMTTMFGMQVLLDALAGDLGALSQVTAGLIGLKFSRKHEAQADEKSVHYLCPTDYNADGGGEFFKKIEEMGGANTPEFLSTHPDPGDRIEHFQNLAITKGCLGTKDYKTEYQLMLSKLP